MEILAFLRLCLLANIKHYVDAGLNAHVFSFFIFGVALLIRLSTKACSKSKNVIEIGFVIAFTLCIGVTIK